MEAWYAARAGHMKKNITKKCFDIDIHHDTNQITILVQLEGSFLLLSEIVNIS